MNAVASEVTGSETAAKAAPEKVTMKDGRTVEFAGKRKLLKESQFPEGQSPLVVLDFRNGETRSFSIPSEFLYRFAAHGAEQKLGDETAGLEDVDDMVLAIDELIERLSKRNAETGAFEGEWSTKREGSGLGGTSILLKALVEKSGKTVDAVKAFLKTKTPADKLALRNSAALKPIIERLESEKLSKAAKVDTDKLLGELEIA